MWIAIGAALLVVLSAAGIVVWLRHGEGATTNDLDHLVLGKDFRPRTPEVAVSSAARDLVDSWLTAMKAGDDTAKYWDNPVLEKTFYALKSWETLSVKPIGDKMCDVVIQVESSNKGGSPIRANWTAMVEKKEAGWKICLLSGQ